MIVVRCCYEAATANLWSVITLTYIHKRNYESYCYIATYKYTHWPMQLMAGWIIIYIYPGALSILHLFSNSSIAQYIMLHAKYVPDFSALQNCMYVYYEA